jgi:2-polyprenyl-3-methyl-5-hydroxy-6-metoxy-1,4-benzoquinol methylase
MPLRNRSRACQAANAKRWSADDDAWRGYRRNGGEIVLEDRVVATLALLELAPEGSMLDVGCATSVITRIMADKARVARVVGVDFEPVATSVETRAVNLDSDECFPFPDATFDVVTCLETLEHVHDTDHLVREISRVLKHDGYAVVSVPRIDGFLTAICSRLGCSRLLSNAR